MTVQNSVSVLFTAVTGHPFVSIRTHAMVTMIVHVVCLLEKEITLYTKRGQQSVFAKNNASKVLNHILNFFEMTYTYQY